MTAHDQTRTSLIRRVGLIYATRADFRELIKVTDEAGERLIVCVLPDDSAGYLFDQLESHGNAGNVIVPEGESLWISYWTCTADPAGELVECSDDATVAMVMACADIEASNGNEVSFERHAGMRLAGRREFALSQ